jgi:LysM repeat protein
MKKFLTFFLIGAFSVGSMLVIGCGGGGQKVSSVSDEESQVMDEASQKAKEELPTTYIVQKGDTLSSIAEKADIYGNKYQWPLIFDANRDILDDYKTVTVGQKLIIPRNVSAVEIEAAKQKASEYGWPDSGKAAAGAVKTKKVSKVRAKSSETASNVSRNTQKAPEVKATAVEEDPTPIPEPVKMKKKGGMNTMAILFILLGVIAVIIFFVISQKKKKDDDEEDKDDKSDNILS